MKLIKYDDDLHRPKLGVGPLHWAKYAKTLLWYPRDTEELFDMHWSNPDKRSLLLKYGWTKSSINYTRNDAGFRMYDDFSKIRPGECDFYLGCSLTFGIGLNVEDTWGWKMSNKNGLPFVNLGWPGSGMETQYRLLRSWAKKLKPKRAFTLGAYGGRRELFHSDHMVTSLGPWIESGTITYKIYERLSNENELLISMIRSLDAMKSVCLEHNIELYTLTENARNEIFDVNTNKNSPLARDLLHFHPMWHNRIVDLPDSNWERLA